MPRCCPCRCVTGSTVAFARPGPRHVVGAVRVRVAVLALVASGFGCDAGPGGDGAAADTSANFDAGVIRGDGAFSDPGDSGVGLDWRPIDAELRAADFGVPTDAVTGAADDGLPDLTVDEGLAGDAFKGDAFRGDAFTGDAFTGDAGGAEADAGPGIPCAVNGRPGVCLDVAECVGERASTPGFCPGLAHIQCCTARPDPAGECDATEHPQPNAGLVENPGQGRCLAGMVRAGGQCIDRYEAALELVADDGTTSPWSPYQNPGNRRVRAVSLADAVPQGYISGRQAARACAEAGKRLCTDEEWLLTCRGAAGRTYPYGPERQPGVCNDARARHPAVELFPNDPNPFARIQDACINQLPDSLARTGDHPACVTPEGIYDLMGNLHEWTADPDGTFRGGFYVDTVVNGPGCLYRTTAHNIDHWDYSTGFRCCAD